MIPLLIPPFRFAIVEEGLYRGAYPTLKNFRFLRRLHLRVILSLTPEPQPNRDIREFCQHEGIISKHFYVEKYQDEITLSTAKIIQILQMLIKQENLPLYLHCLDGTHVTGLVIMCLRKLQSWSLSSSTSEFIKFQRHEEISREESQFVESLRGEIDVPATLPPWLWQGVRKVRHPTFQIRRLPVITMIEKSKANADGINNINSNNDNNNNNINSNYTRIKENQIKEEKVKKENQIRSSQSSVMNRDSEDAIGFSSNSKINEILISQKLPFYDKKDDKERCADDMSIGNAFMSPVNVSASGSNLSTSAENPSKVLDRLHSLVDSSEKGMGLGRKIHGGIHASLNAFEKKQVENVFEKHGDEEMTVNDHDKASLFESLKETVVESPPFSKSTI